MIKRYVKKTFVEAIQFTGDNLQECINFTKGKAYINEDQEFRFMVDGLNVFLHPSDMIIKHPSGYVEVFLDEYFRTVYKECEVEQ